MKQTIRLTESDLHRIVKESVKRTLNESSNETSELKLRIFLKDSPRRFYSKLMDTVPREIILKVADELWEECGLTDEDLK